jgi:hypothetical protein
MLQGKDAERIREFLMEHRPHVVAVGATGLEARQLKVHHSADTCTLPKCARSTHHDCLTFGANTSPNFSGLANISACAAVQADLDAIRDAILEHHARVMTAQETGEAAVPPQGST